MPEPILVAIAAAVASKSAGSLYDFVKRRLARSKGATNALDAAQGTAPDSVEVRELSVALEEAAEADPEFSAELRAMWLKMPLVQHAESDGVTNSIGGNVSGKVVQARDIEGGISF